MTKMAAMPIHDKSFKESCSLEALGHLPCNLVCSTQFGIQYFKVYINDDPGLTLTSFMEKV